MNLNTVYNACMSKMASMEMDGMYKSAAPDWARSAQVGYSSEYNDYAKQLASNTKAKAAEITPNKISKSYKLRRIRQYDHDRFHKDDKVRRKYGPITQAQLDDYRNRKAHFQADMIFEPHTNQFDAAKQYLIERGKENQRRYNDGTLWKNEPTKVPMPKVISKPEDMQALDYAGYTMASNNRSRNPNTGNA